MTYTEEAFRKKHQYIDIHSTNVTWCHKGYCGLYGKGCSHYFPNEDEKRFLYNLWKEGKNEKVMKLYTGFHEDTIGLQVAIFKDKEVEEIKQQLIKKGVMMDGSKHCGQC